MTRDGKPYGPWRYQQLITQCAIVARNFNTSYLDVRDRMTPAELRYLLNIIATEREENEERIRKIREERQQARDNRNYR